MSVLFLALFWLAGVCLLRFLFPGKLELSLHNLWLISLGAGAGMGIASCLYFATLALAGPNLAAMFTVQGVFVIAAVALGARAKPQGSALGWASGPAAPWYLTTLFLAALALATTLFTTHSISKPHGEWDAWSIWNLRARFLFLSGDAWKNAFSNQIPWSHPDYPVLIPGIIALCWTLARSQTTTTPVAVAFLFTFGAAGVLIASLGVLRGKAQAWVGGGLLLGTVGVVTIGAMQYGDVPESLYILAALALLCLQDRDPANIRYTILAGLMAGFAAWTKNEGLLFVLALVIARAIAVLRFGRRAGLARELGGLLAGIAFPLALEAYFKLRLAPPNDLTSTTAAQAIAHLTDFGRWVTAVQGFVLGALGVGSFLVPIALVLLVYWYLVRFQVGAEDRLPLATLLIALGLVLIGEFGVYVLLPNDLVWQLNTSLGRVFLQLWPAAVLAFFVAANAPQLVAKPAPVEKTKPVKQTPKARRRAAEAR